MNLAFMNLGYSEILLILLVAVLLFGGKLPKVARDAGRWFYDLKRGMANLNKDIYEPPPYDPPAPLSGRSIEAEALPAYPDKKGKSHEAAHDKDCSSIEKEEFISDEESKDEDEARGGKMVNDEDKRDKSDDQEPKKK